MRVPIDLTEQVAADDYWWFEARPGRTLRLRRATEPDATGVGPSHAVLVFCPVFALRMRSLITMHPELFDALMAEDADAALAPHFASYIDKLVKQHGKGPSLARRWRKVFQIVREHGRLSALPSRETLDQP